MNIYKILSLDESGKASYNHKSELFILSGVLIDEKFKSKLDIKKEDKSIIFFSDTNRVIYFSSYGEEDENQKVLVVVLPKNLLYWVAKSLF